MSTDGIVLRFADPEFRGLRVWLPGITMGDYLAAHLAAEQGDLEAEPLRRLQAALAEQCAGDDGGWGLVDEAMVASLVNGGGHGQ